jgi:hypothetical protein
MSTIDRSWSYSLALEENKRLPVLLEPHTFVEITHRVVSEMRVLCCHRSEKKATEFFRPVYTVELDCTLFDLFFNSSNGYRAAYFRSPGAGIDANACFMQAVTSRLLADRVSKNSELSEDILRESLSTPSAKVWLAEHGKEMDRNCSGCKGEWSSGSANAVRGAEIANGKWETATGQKAEWGRKAPYLTKLRIMGAFINSLHDELIPYDKRFRAHDIHEFGWS